MVRNFHEDLKSRGFLVDVIEGFVIIVIWFILLLREFLDPTIPFSLDVIKSSIHFSFSFSLFVGIIVLFLPLSLFLDSSVGR